MAYVIDKDQQFNQQYVAPAAPFATLTGAQITRVNETLKLAPNAWLNQWLTSSTSSYHQQFISDLQSTISKFLAPEYEFVSPEAKLTLVLNDVSNALDQSTLEDEILKLIKGDKTQNLPGITIPEALDKVFAVGQHDVSKDINDGLNAILATKLKTRDQRIQEGLLEYFKTEFAKYNVDITSSTDSSIVEFVTNFNDLAKAKATYTSTFTYLNNLITSSLGTLKQDNIDAAWTVLSETKLDNLISSQFKPTAPSVVNQVISKEVADTTRTYVGHVLFHELLPTTNTSLHIQSVNKSDWTNTFKSQILATTTTGSTPISIDVFDAHFLTGIKAVLANRGITNINQLQIFATENFAVTPEYLDIRIEWKPTTTGQSSILISELHYPINDNAPAAQQALGKLQEFINTHQVAVDASKVLFEKDLIDHIHNGSSSFTPSDINSWFAKGAINTWHEVSNTDFVALALQAGQNITLPGANDLDIVQDGNTIHFTYKIYVKPDATSGKLTYKIALDGGTLVSTDKGPDSTYSIAVGSQQYKSNAERIKDALSGITPEFTRKLWQEELFQSLIPVSTFDNKFIDAKTNVALFKSAFDGFITAIDPTKTRYTFECSLNKVVVAGKNLFEFNVIVKDKELGNTNVVTIPNYVFPSEAITSSNVKPANYDGWIEKSTFSVDGSIGSSLKKWQPVSEDKDQSFIVDASNIGQAIPLDLVRIDGKTLDDWKTEIMNQYSISKIDFGTTWTAAPVVDANNPNDPNRQIFQIVTRDTSAAHYGSLATFTVDVADSQGVVTHQTVKVFVNLNVRTATQADLDSLDKEFMDQFRQTQKRINDAGDRSVITDESRNKLLSNAQFTGSETNIKGQENNKESYDGLQKIISDYNQWKNNLVLSSVTAHKLENLVQEYKNKLSHLSSLIPGDMNLDALMQKILAKLKQVGITSLTPGMIDIIKNNASVLVDLVDKLDARKLLEFINNPKMLEWLSKMPVNTLDAFIKTLEIISKNYQYGYFGAGAALGLAGVGGSVASLATIKAASKASKLKTNKLRIKGNKLISLITGGISLLTMGGSATLLILFFTQQGGF